MNIEAILDLSRWAPSGDNTQPWRFEVVDPDHVVVHGHDTQDWVVYDIDGHPSHIGLGALLETMSIAASGQGARTEVSRRLDAPADRPTFDVRFIPDPATKSNPLLDSITRRVTQRRPMSTRPLTDDERSALEAAVDPRFRIAWKETPAERKKIAKLLFFSAEIRLTTPEAFTVHQHIIEWNKNQSEDRIPDQAVGLDPMTLKMMRWTLGDWKRVAFMNRFMAGTVMPRITLDYRPALACAGHFWIYDRETPQSTDDYVEAGRAMQRFWLTATELGLFCQPEMTPLIFANYARRNKRFTVVESAWQRALALPDKLERIWGEPVAAQGVWTGRIGAGPAPKARSTRLPLKKLMI